MGSATYSSGSAPSSGNFLRDALHGYGDAYGNAVDVGIEELEKLATVEGAADAGANSLGPVAIYNLVTGLWSVGVNTWDFVTNIGNKSAYEIGAAYGQLEMAVRGIVASRYIPGVASSRFMAPRFSKTAINVPARNMSFTLAECFAPCFRIK